MAKKTDKPDETPEDGMVKVLCKFSVIHDGETFRPDEVIEMPLEVAEALEEGGFVERVFADFEPLS